MTEWQDKIIAVVSVMFGIFLIPQLIDAAYHHSAINPITAFCTAGGMILLTVVYASEGKKLSTVTTAIQFVLWLLLGIMR